jgi:hypothetical protein
VKAQRSSPHQLCVVTAAMPTLLLLLAHLLLLLQSGNFQELYTAFREALKVTEEDINSFSVSFHFMACEFSLFPLASRASTWVARQGSFDSAFDSAFDISCDKCCAVLCCVRACICPGGGGRRRF